MDHHQHHGHGDHGGHSMDPTTPAPSVISGHDHSQHSGHSHGDPSGESSSLGGHMMHMYFHGGASETILFEFWKISETGGLLLSMVIIFLLAFGYEGLKFYREHLYRHSFQTVQLSTVAVPVENGSLRETHKTVQIGTTAMSNFPYNPDMNPVFLTKMTCECGGDGSSAGPSMCTKDAQSCIENRSAENNNSVTECGNQCSKSQAKSCKPVRSAYKVKVFSAMHGWQTILHIVQMIISYFLMLIFMTYNVWLCIAVALGAGVGYFCFGWKKSVVVDVTEHCH